MTNRGRLRADWCIPTAHYPCPLTSEWNFNRQRTPPRSRRESSLILRFPKSSLNSNPPVVLAKDPHHGPPTGGRRAMVTRRAASLMNGAYNFIIFMYEMAYGHHFSHTNAHITAISSFTPSSTACPVGVQFLLWKRGGSALRSSTTTYCGMFLWSREHRSSLTMSFPSPTQPLNLCMICEETIHCDFPCFVASFISLFILVGLGSQLLGG